MGCLPQLQDCFSFNTPLQHMRVNPSLIFISNDCTVVHHDALGFWPSGKTKQNKTKQNKTKQNKTKQNKTKQMHSSTSTLGAEAWLQRHPWKWLRGPIGHHLLIWVSLKQAPIQQVLNHVLTQIDQLCEKAI